MKEKEVRLTSEEIDYLLKGTIHWEDVSSRVDGPLRKPIDKAPKKDFGLDRKEDDKTTDRNSFESKEIGETRDTIVFSKPGGTRPSFNFKEDRADTNHGEENIEDLVEVDLFEEDHPFWSGTKVYILLSLMGCITLGTWAYFVFA